MPAKRKAPLNTSRNPAFPRTPIVHKQKRLNPPRLCVRKNSTFNCRPTRNRKIQYQLENTGSGEHFQKPEAIQIQETSLEFLTLENESQVPSLVTNVQKMSIKNTVPVKTKTIGKKGKGKADSKNMVVLLTGGSDSESKPESQQSSSTSFPVQKTLTTVRQMKTPMTPSKLKPGRPQRTVAELDSISLIEDTISNNFECFTSNLANREYELLLRENLVEAHSYVTMKMQELRRISAVGLMTAGISQDYLDNYDLTDYLEENGNPESLEEIHAVMAEKIRTANDKLLKANAESRLKDLCLKLKRIDEHSHSDASISPELFCTPKKQILELPPLPPKTHKSTLKNKAQLIFPSPAVMNAGSREPFNIFQCKEQPQSNVKVPRAVRLGEIAFSQSGSPIVAGNSINNIPLTHVQPIEAKPIRIQIDNGDGKAIDVDIVYRGNPKEKGDAKVFREFLTDVRGIVSTRSTARGKYVQPARVPVKAGMQSSSTAKSNKKPQWL